MKAEGIPFKETGYFSSLITDYLDQNPDLSQFYNRFPEIQAFEEQIKEKGSHYPGANRAILVKALQRQYKEIQIGSQTSRNLQALRDENCFTVVTGHQLNLFTGPFYFFYKIVSTVKLTRQLRQHYPEYSFVPVYWMATEDHDFEEINHFNFRGKAFHWNREGAGAVGRMSTEGLQEVYRQFAADLGPGDAASELKKLFREAYLEHPRLADATRFLVNTLFGETGLVILDGDDKELKAVFTPHMEADIFDNLGHKAVNDQITQLQSLERDYPVQVTPREINYFYLQQGIRERLVEENGFFHVLNTDMKFSPGELKAELQQYPERFSPNVITRPLYQETILPNLCYIGGGGELAYWLELRKYFHKSQVPFPILLLRNSAVLVSEKQARKAHKLNIGLQELFLDQQRLIDKKVREISEIDIDFSPQREHLQKQFRELYALAEQTDKSFLGAVKAQEVKQLKGLDNLEKRLLKAQKRKLKDHVNRLTILQNALFPNGNLQERSRNFAEFYIATGPGLIDDLLGAFNPLSEEFSILIYP
ncbi:bacillithiol biosynthesis cysteine-adding enzyme BshC [Robiginitalea sp. IMCC44478]|uniref:bacillithiol biosynthesis cysteine-adding enzyme BshC n=1 Tax=Robiginitalea sp. IMCC44478 TaxID=3459122 RepID=UPI004043864F